MAEIGVRLKEARETKGLTLRELHEITKIQPKYLSAMEEENFEIFPGNVYIKGALRNYAAVLDLNPAEILEVYSETYEKDTVDSQEDMALNNIKRKEKMISPPDGLNKRKVVILLLLTVLLVWIIYYTAGRVDLNFLTDNDTEQTQVDDNGIGIEIPSETEDPPQEENDLQQEEKLVEVILEQENVGEQVFTVKNAELISLEINFSANCWVRIREEGISILENIFREGETLSLESTKELTIRLGNPPGVSTLIVNGIRLTVREEARPYDITLQIN